MQIRAVLEVLFLVIIPLLNGDRTGFFRMKLCVCCREGCVLGTTEEVSQSEKRYEAWYGIPYAAPPINELRFKVMIVFLFELIGINSIVF